jgi:hypothetical protein
MNLSCHLSTFNLMIPCFLLMLALIDFRKGFLSYPILEAKPNTHCMYAHDQLFHTYGPEVFTDNQMSPIKYIYYIKNVSKE